MLLLCYSMSQMPGDSDGLAITDRLQGKRNTMVACHFLLVTNEVNCSSSHSELIWMCSSCIMQQIPFCRNVPSFWCITFFLRKQQAAFWELDKVGWMNGEEKDTKKSNTSHDNKNKNKSGSFLLRTLGIKALLSMPQEGLHAALLLLFWMKDKWAFKSTWKLGSWISWVRAEEAQHYQLFFH